MISNSNKTKLKKSNYVAQSAMVESVPLGTIGQSIRQSNDSIVFYPIKPSNHVDSIEFSDEVTKAQDRRSGGYQIQNTLIGMFKGKITPNGKTWGIHNCLRAVKKKGENVDIIYSESNGLASIRNTQHCKKPFCPHCGASKARKNKAILEALRACHLRAKGCILFMTLTASHTINDSLKSQKIKHDKALKIFNTAISDSGFWQEFGGRKGMAKVSEEKYGQNGWHYHNHFTIYMHDDFIERDGKGRLLDDQPTIKIINNSLAELWQSACKKVGLTASLENGCVVQDGTHATVYLGKDGDDIINMSSDWGSSDEMSQTHLKNNKERPATVEQALEKKISVTPTELLLMYHENGDIKARDLFIESAYANFNRAKIYIYPQTRDGYDIKGEIQAMKDAEIAEKAKQFTDNIIPEDRFFIGLPHDMWRAIVHCDTRDQLLRMVEKDASNGDFEHRYNTQALITHCMKLFQEHLIREKNKADIEDQIKDKVPIKVKFMSEKEKSVKKRYGLKSLSYGLDLLTAMDKLVKSPQINTVPSWVLDVPMPDEIPLYYEQNGIY